ncbi:hypothetical protein K502DRAFT_364026 [Neoconidiobolus thromboides FSU 785]|nr:hypothetical protein K502DRAFT_364026 [Neoconidiobolus thromboides FSU 785]
MSGQPPINGQHNKQQFTSPPYPGGARPPTGNIPPQGMSNPPFNPNRPHLGQPNFNPNARPIPGQPMHHPGQSVQQPGNRPPFPHQQMQRPMQQNQPPRPGPPQQQNFNRGMPQPQHILPNPVPNQQNQMNQLNNQFNSMNLQQQQQPVVDSKPKVRSRYANDPSLSPGSNTQQLPNYGMSSPPASYQANPNMNPGMGQPSGYNNLQGGQDKTGFQQRKAIDINMAPSAVEFQLLDQQEYLNEPYFTLTKDIVPKASSDYCAIDNGNANPKFMRITTRNVSVSGELQEASHIPLALVVQPLAELREDEIPVQEVDFGEQGPIRCTRCKAYINPFVTFVSGGRKYLCNLCRFENEVPDAYFCNLDMNGRRLDADQRAELRFGSVDFVATKEFCNRPPAPASIVFAVDISWNAVQNGSLHQSIQAIKNVLYGPAPVQNVKIGLITFDRNVHFYNFNACLDQAQMLVVSDSNDPFVPLSDGFLVDPNESRHVIEPFLEALPTMYGNNRTAEAALGAALTCGQLALAETGGRIFAFQTCLPSYGAGALKSRDNLKLFGTEKEKALFACADSFYEKLGQNCVESGVSIDLFISTNTYVDIATIGFPTIKTGGELFFYPGFDPKKHGIKLSEDLVKVATRPFGTSGVLRVRCSDGLIVDRHIGNFLMRNSADVELGALDSEKTITALIQHESGKLDEKLDVSFQVALLYTRSTGERRIRVHNLSVPVTTLMGNIFKFADIDCLMNVLAKLSVMASLETPLKTVRDNLTEKSVKILTSYRKNCAQGTSPGQLILPEVLKLLPLYTNSLLKNKALRAGMDVSLDLRVANLFNWLSRSVTQSLLILYPRVAALHTLSPEVGKPGENGRVLLPPLTRAAYTFLEPTGAYLLEDGDHLFLWLGRKIDQGFLSALFGVSAIEQVDPNLNELPHLDNPFSEQVSSVIKAIKEQRSHGMNLQIVRQQLDASEVEFCNLLSEDKNLDNPSYVDYLCLVHRQIQTESKPPPPAPKFSFH